MVTNTDVRPFRDSSYSPPDSSVCTFTIHPPIEIFYVNIFSVPDRTKKLLLQASPSHLKRFTRGNRQTFWRTHIVKKDVDRMEIFLFYKKRVYQICFVCQQIHGLVCIDLMKLRQYNSTDVLLASSTVENIGRTKNHFCKMYTRTMYQEFHIPVVKIPLLFDIFFIPIKFENGVRTILKRRCCFLGVKLRAAFRVEVIFSL